MEADIPVSGGTLHTESYPLPGAKRAVLLLHGYTESAEKLRELVWYFLHAGFSVFSYDHRGHGRSLRQVSDLSVTHVDRFADYVDDAEAVLEQLVLPGLNGAALYLFGHSMGGAVSGHLLQRRPTLFTRAVLSSPMVMPSTGSVPYLAGKAMARTMCAAGKGSERAFVGNDFDAGSEIFEPSCTTSPARFGYYAAKRAANPHLQNCSPTYRWVLESMRQTAALMDKKRNAIIPIPVLLCQAALDDVVLLPPQDTYIRQLPHGKLLRFEGAKHEIYNATDDVMQPYVRQLLTFLTEGKE